MSSIIRSAGLVALVSLAACAGADTTSPAADNTVALAKGSATASAAGEVKVIIALTAPAGAPFRSAKGKAKFASKGGERELQIEAENIPAGTAVKFLLDGAEIGTGTANALRAVRLNLNSDLGATVPTSVAGKKVSVTTAAGAVIVSGGF